MATADSKWAMSTEEAGKYMIDPLMAPDPVDETGLNSHFRSTFAPKTPSPAATQEAIPTTTPNTHRRSPSNPNSPTSPTHSANRSRGNSLGERYPGDMSHRPLQMLKKDNKVAHRSPHLRKRSIPGVDLVDSLDGSPFGQYHHEGPFDATLASRNQNPYTAPVAAVAESNAQALNATAPEHIRDAVNGHRPLDGVAEYPPGEADASGRTYNYRETNLMTDEGGDLGKYKGLEDKFEPTEDDQEMQKQANLYEIRDGTTTAQGSTTTGIEMQDRPKSKKGVDIRENEIDGEPSQSTSKRHSHSLSDGLKKRIGSLRRKKD